MSTTTRIKPYTFDDFCFLVSDGQKGDLIDGVIYMASPDNTDANDLFVWLLRLMSDYAEIKELVKVYGSRVALRLDKINSPEPDIVFVKSKRRDRIKRGFVDGPSDIAVEIVSPDSIDRDYVKKRAQYERHGIREYWILDEIEKTSTFLHRDKNRKYQEVSLRKGEFHSKVLTGFWFRPEWLWQTPRPRKVDALRIILTRTK